MNENDQIEKNDKLNCFALDDDFTLTLNVKVKVYCS